MRKKIAINALTFLIILIITASVIIFLSDKLGFIKLSEIRNSIQSNLENVNENKEDSAQVIDERPLELDSKEAIGNVYEGQTAVEVKSNKRIRIDQSNRLNLFFIKEDKQGLWYVLEINNIGLGDSTVKVDFKDEANNVKTLTYVLSRKSIGLPSGVSSIPDWPNSVYIVNGNNYTNIVDRTHKLVDTYVPDANDIVDLNKDYLLYTNSEGITLRLEAADNLKLMLSALQAEKNVNLVIATGYRSFSDQVKLYAYWYTQKGQESADITSARPGFSEHQLGTAVDFISQETNYALTQEFDNTIGGQWLKENSYKFGFVQSNHAGVEQVNGVPSEAWHYRYIGVEKATEYKQSGLSFPEWIKKENGN